jgi:prepilin-type N-terminal cleavage/methylation domain-containing protein
MNPTGNPSARAEERGFSLIEVLIGSVILLAILGGLGTTLITGRNASQQTSALISIDDKLRTILRRVSEEVRSASRTAADNNWNVGANSLTFNRALPDGTYSPPITYRLNGDLLEYVTTGDLGVQIVTPLATSVDTFTVVENNTLVTITLGVSVRSGSGAMLSGTQSINVSPRN